MQPCADARAARRSWSLIGPTVAQGEWLFAADLPVFRGHFPDRPLVPGVYLIACVVELACVARACRLTLRLVERAKWSAPALPSTLLTVQVVWSTQAQAQSLRLDGTVRSGETLVASCRLVVEERSDAV
jgi:3-hydroxyacyl-[acyl-carrier-protein] dehydratase